MIVDSGVQYFEFEGGTLRFNPADPALFLRLEQLPERIRDLPDEPLTADRELKALLNWVFGPGNDVDCVLQGVSLLARGNNGKTVLENFMAVLTPILEEGAERCAESC